MRTYSTAFRRLITHTIRAPGYASRQEICAKVAAFYESIINSDNPLALKELAVLFSIKISLLKQIILRHLSMFRLYYRTAATDNKILIMRMDCKFRQDPEVFMALLIGLLKFAGYTDDFIRYRGVPRNKTLTKIIWPKDLDDTHKILSKVCAGPIDDYPETVAFLAVNYVYPGKTSKSDNKARLCTAIDLLLFDLLSNRQAITDKKDEEK